MIKTRLYLSFLAACALVLSPVVGAAPKVYTPKPGSKERKAILDALRVPVAKEYKQRPTFTDVGIDVCQGWAHVETSIVGRDGKGLGMDLGAHALLRKSGSKWRVLEWGQYGDPILPEWAARYPQAPKAVFRDMSTPQ